MTHRKQHSKCAVPLGIKWVRFRCGVQKCRGLQKEMMPSAWGAGGSTRSLEAPVGTLDTMVSAHSAPVPPGGSHSSTSTATPGHGLRARDPHEHGGAGTALNPSCGLGAI